MYDTVYISSIIIDNRRLMTNEEAYRAKKPGNTKIEDGQWTAHLLLARSFDEYERFRNDHGRFAKDHTLFLGERRVSTVVYIPDDPSEIDAEAYRCYAWMVMNLLCPLREHVKANFLFDFDDIIEQMSRLVPEVKKWDELRRSCAMVGAPVMHKGELSFYTTSCLSYKRAKKYIEDNFVGEVMYNLFPTEDGMNYVLARVWFENEADAALFGLEPIDKWRMIIGDTTAINGA